MSQEKVYYPVDIGQHIDLNEVQEENLPDVEDVFFLSKDNREEINPEVYQALKAHRDEWLSEHKDEYLGQHAADQAFRQDEDHQIEVLVKEFSDKRVRVYIVFTLGHSRWHHYHILLKNYLIDRDETVDGIFRINELEELYAATFQELGHGASFLEVLKSLGLNYREYIGQSPQYRNLYFPDHDLEVIIQDGYLKYLRQGKPAWVEKLRPEAEEDDQDVTFSYENFNVRYIPELGFAAIDKSGNFLFEVFPYDNGPDYPSDGFIRILEKGKIGYADLDGRVVIQPQFECAYPFQQGVAYICEEGNLVKEGEHESWKEAKWGAINKEGNIIVVPFDLGMFTMEVLDLKVYVHQHLAGQIIVQARWDKPELIEFSVIGEGASVYVDVYSTQSGMKLLGYMVLPWQDLYGGKFHGTDARIIGEQLVTVTPKAIVYIVFLAPGLSDEESDLVMEISDVIQQLLGCDEAKKVVRVQDGFTSSGGLKVISYKEYTNYIDLSVATPGTGPVSPDQLRKEFPRKMILLHQTPDMGEIRSDWIKPGPPEDYIEEPDTSPEELIHPDDIFPDYQPKRTPDTMLDYMPSLLEDLARIPESNLSNLSNLIHLYNEYKENAAYSPGEWVDGNLILGAREKEYQPSPEELVLNEIGDRIISVVSETDPEALGDVLKQIGKCPKKIEFTRFFFIHYDVMGSGRFFYIDRMEKIEFVLPK